MTARMASSWSWARAVLFLSRKTEPSFTTVPWILQLRPSYLGLLPKTLPRRPLANLFHFCRALHASPLQGPAQRQVQGYNRCEKAPQ